MIWLHLRSYMGDIAATGSTMREVKQMKSFVITMIETNKRSENEQNIGLYRGFLLVILICYLPLRELRLEKWFAASGKINASTQKTKQRIQ